MIEKIEINGGEYGVQALAIGLEQGKKFVKPASKICYRLAQQIHCALVAEPQCLCLPCVDHAGMRKCVQVFRTDRACITLVEAGQVVFKRIFPARCDWKSIAVKHKIAGVAGMLLSIISQSSYAIPMLPFIPFFRIADDR